MSILFQKLEMFNIFNLLQDREVIGHEDSYFIQDTVTVREQRTAAEKKFFFSKVISQKSDNNNKTSVMFHGRRSE